jgi:hypothetical protein
MKLWKSIFVFLIVLLAACGSTEILQEHEYEEFRDKVNSEDFTGFAYMLRSERAYKDNYLGAIENVFESEQSNLIYTSLPITEGKLRDLLNDDVSNPKVYLPRNKVAYIENGNVISEFDISDQIFSSENNSELRQFIQNH